VRRKCSTRVRSRGRFVLNNYSKQVKLFAYLQECEDWKQWVRRTISQRAADELVRDGEAQAVTRQVDGVVTCVGYRAVTPTGWSKSSPSTLTFGTLVAVGKEAAGRGHLSRAEKMHIIKFRVWPLIGDTKAVAVRPRISETERRHAEQLLRCGYSKQAAPAA
jgi:hypothetical protein